MLCLFTATLYELEIITNELNALIKDMKSLAEDEKLPVNLLAALDSAYIRYFELDEVLQDAVDNN